MNRINESEAEIRRIDREILGSVDIDDRGHYIRKPNTPERTERYKALKSQQEEKRDYWKKRLEDIGGVKYSRDSVKKEGMVKFLGNWYPVVRVNPKSVTVGRWLDCDMTYQVPYAELHGYVEPDKVEEVKKRIAEKGGA